MTIIPSSNDYLNFATNSFIMEKGNILHLQEYSSYGTTIVIEGGASNGCIKSIS
jgi:hypothetical protein